MAWHRIAHLTANAWSNLGKSRSVSYWRTASSEDKLTRVPTPANKSWEAASGWVGCLKSRGRALAYFKITCVCMYACNTAIFRLGCHHVSQGTYISKAGEDAPCYIDQKRSFHACMDMIAISILSKVEQLRTQSATVDVTRQEDPPDCPGGGGHVVMLGCSRQNMDATESSPPFFRRYPSRLLHHPVGIVDLR